MQAKKWEVVFKHDIKYSGFTLEELLTWVRDHVPAGTKNEDVSLEVEIDQSSGYYDEVIVDAELTISVEK
jgi:hypothetical protein